MKFPRNSKLLRSPFDAAPFAAMFFLLVIFLMLGALLPTPGVPLELPVAANLPGTDKPTIFLAVDVNGRYFFKNKILPPGQLGEALRAAVTGQAEPPTLVINADKTVTYDQLMRLTLLARDAGITNALLATLPDASGKAAPRP